MDLPGWEIPDKEEGKKFERWLHGKVYGMRFLQTKNKGSCMLLECLKTTCQFLHCLLHILIVQTKIGKLISCRYPLTMNTPSLHGSVIKSANLMLSIWLWVQKITPNFQNVNTLNQHSSFSPQTQPTPHSHHPSELTSQTTPSHSPNRHPPAVESTLRLYPSYP